MNKFKYLLPSIDTKNSDPFYLEKVFKDDIELREKQLYYIKKINISDIKTTHLTLFLIIVYVLDDDNDKYYDKISDFIIKHYDYEIIKKTLTHISKTAEDNCLHWEIGNMYKKYINQLPKIFVIKMLICYIRQVDINYFYRGY